MFVVNIIPLKMYASLRDDYSKVSNQSPVVHHSAYLHSPETYVTKYLHPLISSAHCTLGSLVRWSNVKVTRLVTENVQYMWDVADMGQIGLQIKISFQLISLYLYLLTYLFSTRGKIENWITTEDCVVQLS